MLTGRIARFLLLLFLPGMLWAGTARFDSGGLGSVVDGQAYQADREYSFANGSGYIGGSSYVPERSLAGGPIEGSTASQAFLQTIRQGTFEYRFDVPAGQYLLTLHFVETALHGPHLREFLVSAEGNPLLAGFDIFDRVEKNYAQTYRFAVNVFDGQLNVSFTPSIGEAILSGIAVDSITADSTAPVTPTLQSANGYYRAILGWSLASDPDVAGYRIYRSDAPGGPYNLLNLMPTPSWRYFDDAVDAGVTRYYRLTALDVFGNESAMSGEAAVTPRDHLLSPLPVWEFTIPSANLATLQADPFADEYVSGDFRFGQDLYPDVGFRYRGSVSRTYNKKSWKVNFKSSARYRDRDKLNLKAQATDGTMMRDCLVHALMKSTAMQTPECLFGHLEVNGEYRGVFSSIEQPDEYFLRERGLNDEGPIYEAEDGRYGNFAILPDYSLGWQDDSADEIGFGPLQEFIELVNLTPEEDFAKIIASKLNVNAYLDYWASIILTSDLDHVSHNYYMYMNPDSGIWEVISTGHDSSFLSPLLPINYGMMEEPDIVFNLHNVLTDRVLKVGRFRQMYINKLVELVQTNYSAGYMDPLVNNYLSQIFADARVDVYKLGREQNDWIYLAATSLRSFMNQRRVAVLQQAAALDPHIPTLAVINELQAGNVAGPTDESGEHEDWIELYNPNGQGLDVGGWYLTDDPQQPTKWMIPAGTSILAGGHLLVWADGDTGQGPLHASFSLSKNGESVALYGPDSLGNPLFDVIAYASLEDDGSYGRRFSGSTIWGAQITPSPNAANTGKVH